MKDNVSIRITFTAFVSNMFGDLKIIGDAERQQQQQQIKKIM